MATIVNDGDDFRSDRRDHVEQSTTKAQRSRRQLLQCPPLKHPSDNTALIGGIVGGVVALFLIIGLIVFIVTRNRRKVANNQDQPSNRNDVSMAPAKASASNYGQISARSNVYDESFLTHSPATNYDDAAVLAINNYGTANANANANQNQTHYDNPDVLSH
jgi:hypothetical protein